MKKNSFFLCFFLATIFLIAQQKPALKKGFVLDETLFEQGWFALEQPNFWQKIMNSHGDSLFFNLAHNRQIVSTFDQAQWKQKNEEEKNLHKTQLRDEHCAERKEDTTCQIYATYGRNHYFLFDKIMPYIPKANQIFLKEDVDPFYAQSILLVESPNNFNNRSHVGARGPFQLMKNLAQQYGMIVNKKVDQRTNLEHSAKVAARFIKQVCIRRMNTGLKNFFPEEKINPQAIWYRLLILHAYHAGPGNVLSALEQIQPQDTGIQIIQQLWQTQYRHFKNASQNYSQLILAAHSILYEKLGFKKEIEAKQIKKETSTIPNAEFQEELESPLQEQKKKILAEKTEVLIATKEEKSPL